MTAVRIVDNRVRISMAVLQRTGKALNLAAAAGARYYRKSVPVRTGTLKRSARRLGSPTKLLRAWGSDPSAPHSRFVELGTRKKAARPRLKESVQVARQTLIQELKNV